jgi:hypothetical protein
MRNARVGSTCDMPAAVVAGAGRRRSGITSTAWRRVEGFVVRRVLFIRARYRLWLLLRTLETNMGTSTLHCDGFTLTPGGRGMRGGEERERRIVSSRESPAGLVKFTGTLIEFVFGEFCKVLSRQSSLLQNF